VDVVGFHGCVGAGEARVYVGSGECCRLDLLIGWDRAIRKRLISHSREHDLKRQDAGSESILSRLFGQYLLDNSSFIRRAFLAAARSSALRWSWPFQDLETRLF
jgi:hypothetical protein